jgi:hypothetical protein
MSDRHAPALAIVVAAFGSALALASARADVRPTPERPVLCSQAEIRTLVKRYVDAFNRGAFRTLDRHVFAVEPEFRWYSTSGPGPRVGPASRDRATLIRHLRTRFAAGDRLQMISLRVNSNSRGSRGSPYGNFDFDIIRHAGESARPGKGAAYCYATRADRIFVWSMGDPGAG